MKTESLRKSSVFLRGLSVACAMALLFETAPLSAIAEGLNKGTSDHSSSTTEVEKIDENSTYKKPTIVAEDIEKRTEESKEFVLSDGSRMIAMYGTPVHYENEKGKWKDYDNTIQSDTSKMFGILPSTTSEYKNKDSDKDIRLSNKAKEKKMISIKAKGFPLSWGFKNIKNSRVDIIKKKDVAKEGDDAFLSLPKLTQEAWYHNVYPQVDMQYFITSTGVKENIILKSNKARHEYIMNYNIGDLVATQVDERTIHLKNTEGKIVYVLAAPIMTDTNGETSENITLEITNQKNKMLTVCLTADNNWLDAEEREYPVTIDPNVLTDQTTTGIENATLLSCKSSYPYGSLLVGRESTSYGRVRSVVKMTNLPKLRTGDIVIGASLNLLQVNFNGNSDVQVNVSKNTSAWSYSELASHDFLMQYGPAYDSTIEDYSIANANTIYNRKEESSFTNWDITKTVKGWYNGDTNNGLSIWADNPDAFAYANYTAARDATSFNPKSYPTILISYVNNNGLEDYWSYHSQSVGTRGTAHINDYSGNLVVTEDAMSQSGALMPANVTMVYNSQNYDHQVPCGMIAGKGWQFNFSQHIDYAHIDGYKYKYTDADGTEHYFKKNSNGYYEDEEGLGLKLGEDPKCLYIWDKNGGERKFKLPEESGLLLYERDADFNYREYTSSYQAGGFAITSIKDGAQRETKINYETFGGRCRIKSILGPQGYMANFEYPDPGHGAELLTKIKYSDGTFTRYIYDGNGRLETVRHCENEQTVFSYDNLGRVIKMQNSTPYHGNYELGSSLRIAYNNDCSTTFTNHRGVSETVQFDVAGRPTSTILDDGTTSNTSFCGKGVNDPSESKYYNNKENNKVKSSSSSEKFVNNYVVNPSAENGGFYNYGSGNTYDNQVAYIGQYSLKLNHTKKENGFQAQVINIPGNRTVTASAYVKTQNVSAANYADGATMHVAWFNGTTYIGQKALPYGIKGTTDWQRISITACLPSNANRMTVYLDLNHASGTAWFDGIQVEDGAVMNCLNLLNDSSIDRTGTWSTRNLQSGDLYRGNGEVYLKGKANANKHVFQTVSINKANVCFNVYGKAQAWSVPLGLDSRCFAMELSIEYENGKPEFHTKQFNYATNSQQHISMNVKPKEPWKIKNVSVYFIYRNNANSAYFYQAMLNIDQTGTSYSYDANGNIKKASDNAQRKQSYTYNNANELTNSTNQKNESYSYNYATSINRPHRITSARSKQLQNGFTFGYDSKGNVTSTKMGSLNESGTLDTNQPNINSSREYNKTHNYVVKETDARGNSVEKDVNDRSGLVRSVKSPAPIGSGENIPVTTKYTYRPETYLVDSVSQNVDYSSKSITNYYGYDSLLRFNGVYHNGFNTNICYDNWGRQSGTNIQTDKGKIWLANNTYEKVTGNLLGVNYGNGKWYNYSYDRYDRMISKRAETGLLSSYAYNNQNLLAKVDDYAAGNTLEYGYDLIGRLTDFISYGTNKLHVKYSHDNMNNVTSQTNYGNGWTHGYGATYGKDNLIDKSMQGLFEFYYDYDNLNRVVSKSMNVSGTSQFQNATKYEYLNVKRNETTSLISNMYYFKGNEFQGSFRYTYDNAGNIKSITDHRGLKISYEYDKLNQLRRENNQFAGRTYTYDYDNGGNITLKREYAYTTGGLSTPSARMQYSYNDPIWKDRLTSYRSYNITYDKIGNPLNYRNGMKMTWQRGRQLATLQKGSTAVSYQYNESGLRTKKTVNGVTTIYDRDASGNIVHQKGGNNELWYYYDAQGNIGSISHNGTRYALRKNAQGDVIALMDTNGDVVAQYAYDAWGNVLDVTDYRGRTITDPNHVALANPIRYRGYFYDTETGFYHLQSRYYDPMTCRFLNADGAIGVNNDMSTYNLFVYCGNNPVVRYDNTGMFWKELISGVVHTGNNFAVAIGIDTAAIGASFLMMKQDDSGVYHASFDCWQQYAGYNDLYDFAFNLGTSMEAAKFSFSYNGSGYTIWAWKGDYINLGAGAELGIYRGSSGHRTVDTSLAMWMGMGLIYDCEIIINYFPDENQWWITGFNPKYQNVNASDLTAVIGVGFNSSGMYQAFKNKWGGDSRWSFHDYIDLAVLIF